MSNIRADRLNEQYYALTNAPTYNQFKPHFIDNKGRLYMIAEYNKEPFQNERVQFKKKRSNRSKQCITDTFGFIKLYVKIPIKLKKHHMNEDTCWFSYNEIDSKDKVKLRRYDNEREDGSNSNFINITIKNTEKPLRTRSTGSVFIKGLDISYCNQILNQY